jgi:hypothetical protein
MPIQYDQEIEEIHQKVFYIYFVIRFSIENRLIDYLLFYVPLRAFEQGGIFIVPHLL